MPFSAMGKNLKEQDPRFQTHTAYYNSMSQLCDALLIENVPGYDPEVARRHLGAAWNTQHCVLDPRVFGVPCARTRIYILAWRKSKLEWRNEIKIEDVVDAVARKVVATAGACFWQRLPESTLTEAQAQVF